MRKIKTAAVFLLLFAITACTPNKTEQDVATEVDTTAAITAAIDRFLTERGAQYTHGDVCIPCPHVVKVDASTPDDVRVWGNFYVYNYNVSGDTLKCVSGGSHPGLLHMKKDGEGFAVTSFDEVTAGTGNVESAKQIFGEYYDAFHAITSDEVKREHVRAELIGEYVKSHDMKVTLYQDYGWPAHEIPLK